MKRKQVAKVVDSSHSDSPTSLNNQSESWECPLSTRKRLVPDPFVICHRRASLRSAKGSAQTRMTSLNASHGPECSLIEVDSSSGQDSHTSNLATEIRHEEAERVGNFTAPSENCAEVEDVNEAEKSISMLGRPSPSFSLNITEMVNMRDNGDDDILSVGQNSSLDTVERYQVKPEFRPILTALISKRGDIAKDSTMLTLKYRSVVLEMVCDIISELRKMDFNIIEEDELHDMIALVNEIKNKRVDIDWLHQRLVEILEAKQTLKLSGVLKEEKESNVRIIENVERELGECEAEKEALEAKLQSIYDKEAVCNETLAKAMDEFTMITKTIEEAKSKVKRFLNCSLANGLL